MTEQRVFGLRDHEPLLVRLAQAVWWCRERVDVAKPAECLRSERLRPSILQANRADAVKLLCIDRARAITNVNDLRAVGKPDDLAGGDLLLYLPDQQLADGAAEEASGGFFDVNNAPAWDTWVALIRDEKVERSSRDQLICFVPRELRQTVQRGIDVNPEGCILWLRDATFVVADALPTFL